MSRIEKAMERAQKLRQEGSHETSQPMPHSAAQAPVNQAPVNQTPVNQAPVNQAPVNQAPVNPWPGSPPPVNPHPVNQAAANPWPANNPPLPKMGSKNSLKFDNPYLVNIINPHSETAEEFRKLKTVVKEFALGEKFKNLIMVTSALPDEGKSITTLNLSISLAQEFDNTVLLVDCNLRKPSIARLLGLPDKNGFSDCIAGDVDLGKVIINTGIGRLSVIPGGPAIPNPVEYFTSQKMKSILGEMKHRYNDRFLIIDSPPVLPYAETRALAQIVDGVIFVAKERHATSRNINEALEALKGCQMLGLVYNDAYPVDALSFFD